MSEEVKDGDNGEEAKEFNAGAFNENGIVDSVENADNISDEEKNNTPPGDKKEDGDGDEEESFSWDNIDDGESDKSEEEKTKEEKVEAKKLEDERVANLTDEEKQKEVDDAEAKRKAEEESGESEEDKKKKEEENKDSSAFDGSLTNEHFTAFAEELGLKATNLDELKQGMLDLEAENTRLKESAGGNVTNKKIDSLQTYLKLDDNELIKKDLEMRGFKDDKLEKALDTLQDNGMLEIEATKVRNAITGSIDNERSAITKESRDEDAKQLQDREDSVKALNTYLGDQTEMFGFKMAKDEETLVKVRDNHHKYITSGSYLKEITKDNESLAESAWLWKNRDTLLKAARNGGLQQGRSEILSELHNPDVDGGRTFVSPDGKGEFNVSQFRGENKKKK